MTAPCHVVDAVRLRRKLEHQLMLTDSHNIAIMNIHMGDQVIQCSNVQEVRELCETGFCITTQEFLDLLFAENHTKASMALAEAMACLVQADDPEYAVITTMWVSALAMQSSVICRRRLLCIEQSCNHRHVVLAPADVAAKNAWLEKQAVLRATAQDDAALVTEIQRLDAMLARTVTR